MGPLLVTVMFLCFALESYSYPSGAPLESCKSMTPSHGYNPQPSSSSPYTITLDKTTVQRGQPVHVTLTSASGEVPFAGFLAMGQKHNSVAYGESEFGFGTVTFVGNDMVATPLSCHNVKDSALTHGWSTKKPHVLFDWIAPHTAGEYVILATFVQSADTFWIRQPSHKITVT